MDNNSNQQANVSVHLYSIPQEAVDRLKTLLHTGEHAMNDPEKAMEIFTLPLAVRTIGEVFDSIMVVEA